MLVGELLGIVPVALDLVFSNFNSVGKLPHPPFSYSVVASISAGIGEEMIFRLFFISLFVWLFSRVLLNSKNRDRVFWTGSLVSAFLFSIGHLPSLTVMLRIRSFAGLSIFLVGQVILMNSVISMFAAYYFRKYGFLAPVEIHSSADVIWHAIYGGLLAVR
jgi:membrane protease YdiL (CAAX protease family)